MPLTKVADPCHSSGIVNVFALCPADPEEAADAYLLRRMSLREAEEFDLHLARCPRCSKTLETTRTFIQALRDATHDLPMTRAAHSTG
jgi:uncharacterized protein with PIN domain